MPNCKSQTAAQVTQAITAAYPQLTERDRAMVDACAHDLAQQVHRLGVTEATELLGKIGIWLAQQPRSLRLDPLGEIRATVNITQGRAMML